MRTSMTALAVLGISMTALAQAPGPDDRPGPRGQVRRPDAANLDGFLNRLLSFDANQDGEIQKDEMTDARLQPLMQRADGDQNDIVTKEELTTLFARESATLNAARRGGVARGPGDALSPSRGQLLPPPLQQALRLTEEQRRQLDELQKDVDARLVKILTEEQRRQLGEFRERTPRGPGFGGPGGPPPRNGDRRPPNE